MAAGAKRIDWIDAVKGLTIILVVTKHATYNDAIALGRMPYLFNYLSELTVPFRMPLFFLVGGLFAMRALREPLREFIDKKVLHFVYFYVLWSFIQIGIKLALPGEGHWAVRVSDLALIPLEPFGLMWFIYALAVFFIVARLTRDVPKPLILAAALALYFARLETGWTMPDEFARRFIFFVSGVYGAPFIFRMADWAIAYLRAGTAAGLALLAFTGVIVFSGVIEWRALELLAGYAGASASIMLIAILASKDLVRPLSYVGSRSLYVFLAFFLPMAATRILMVRLGFTNGDFVTLVDVVMAVVLPLIAFRLVERTPLAFLFVRPAPFRLRPGGGDGKEVPAPI